MLWNLLRIIFFWCIGALDVTEGIGAAFGIPHVPELWEEVNRAHSRSRSNSYRVRSRSRTHSTRSAVGREVRGEVMMVGGEDGRAKRQLKVKSTPQVEGGGSSYVEHEV